MSYKPWQTSPRDRKSEAYRKLHADLAACVGGFFTVSCNGEPTRVERHRKKSEVYRQTAEIQ